MGLWDIRPYSSFTGGTVSIRWAPMKAAEAFLPGEPITIELASGLAKGRAQDGTQYVIADGVAGLPINGPGLQTATAAKPASRGYGRLYQHPDTGNTYATNDKIWYVPFDENNLFQTNIVLATGGAAGVGAAFTGADRGRRLQITADVSTDPDIGWGLERTAAAIATDYVAEIYDILDANGKSVTATGTGVTAVFRIIS